MSQENEQGSFAVKDKRRFAKEENENLSRETSKEETVEKDEREEKNKGKGPESKAPEDNESQAFLPEVNFSSFILSLSTSVYIHLGLVPDPLSQARQRNLQLAKQSIDIIGMLKEKTGNNLTKEESQLIDNILYDLRMKYVEEMKKQ